MKQSNKSLYYMFNNVFILLLISLFLEGMAMAAGSLSLPMAIDEALKDSPVVEEANANLDLAKWQLVSQRADLLPKLSFFAAHNFDTKYETLPFNAGPISTEVPITFPKTAYGLELNWTLFNGLANWNENAASGLKKDAANTELTRRRFETRKKIEFQFYAVLAAVQMRDVATQNLKTIQDNLAISEARLRNGVSTAPDVLRVQVQETEALAEVQRTTDAIVIQREKLRQAMGLEQDDRELSGVLPLPSAKESISKLPFPGLGNRDDIKASQLKDEAADKAHSAAIGKLLPSVALVGRMENYDNTDYEVSGSKGSYRNAYNIGVALRWNILDGGETIAKPGIASAQREIERTELRKAVISAPTDFELWKRRYTYSADLYEARMRDIKRAEESLRIIKLSFEQGRRIINEVLDAETDLFRARAGAVQSQFEAAEALNQLELVVGKDLL